MTNFITVTTVEESHITKLPKVLAINIDRITTVEPVQFEHPISMDSVEMINGCMITVVINVTNYQEILCRDPFDQILERIRIAGAGIVCKHNIIGAFDE